AAACSPALIRPASGSNGSARDHPLHPAARHDDSVGSAEVAVPAAWGLLTRGGGQCGLAVGEVGLQDFEGIGHVGPAADGVATRQHEYLVQSVRDAMWQPVYPGGYA
ncbi:MAG TPA: hypothetical protein VMD50_23850, partial [Mycobacterium sp.]|nr:hypothetical protein [Mycobacterium sp.]